jgi:hypothetical protein
MTFLFEMVGISIILKQQTGDGRVVILAGRSLVGEASWASPVQRDLPIR